MKILDAHGRLFGKVNVLDLGAVLIILLVLIGIFFSPGNPTSLAQVSTVPVEFEVMVRGLSVRNPQALFQVGDNTSLVIRNQPSGSVKITKIEDPGRSVFVPQPDGSVALKPAPGLEAPFTADFLLTLAGQGQLTGDGPVLGGSKVKIGLPVRLEGKTYDFNGTIIDVRA